MKNVKSQRIASWVYWVINPIVDGLEREVHWLADGNLTWRFYSRKAEFILPLEEYLDPQYIHSYRHFLRHFNEWQNVFERHNSLLRQTELKAQEIVDHLSQCQKFSDLCQEKLNTYIEQEGEYPGGSVPQEKFLCLICEHLVNCVEDVPLHYADSEFWSQFGKIFQNAYQSICSQLSHRLKQSKDELHECAKKISEDLGNQCYQLCEEYDIPADHPCSMEM